MNEFKNGLKDGIPIALGYFAVSFSFGILAIKGGLSVFQAVLTSVTNVTSAGQFAGLQIIIAGGTILEVILTQLIINLRYGLMSLSLTQKLADDVGIWKRLIIAFANTDEIFAVAMGYFKEVTFPYMLGLQILPILGWGGGTFAGAVASGLLPKSVCSALSLALYGMFLAIVVPVAKICVICGMRCSFVQYPFILCSDIPLYLDRNIDRYMYSSGSSNRCDRCTG